MKSADSSLLKFAYAAGLLALLIPASHADGPLRGNPVDSHEKPLTQATLERSLNLMRMVPGVTFMPASPPRRADGLALKLDGYHYQAKPRGAAVEMPGFDRTVKTDG